MFLLVADKTFDFGYVKVLLTTLLFLCLTLAVSFVLNFFIHLIMVETSSG